MIAQQNTKTRRAAAQTILFLIGLTFLVMIENRSEDKLKKEIFILLKNIILTKNWLTVSTFPEFPEHPMEKLCSRHLYFY